MFFFSDVTVPVTYTQFLLYRGVLRRRRREVRYIIQSDTANTHLLPTPFSLFSFGPEEGEEEVMASYPARLIALQINYRARGKLIDAMLEEIT